MPNPWDAGSARYLASLGFKALASTSAGMAFAMGRPDGTAGVTLEQALRHLRDLVEATEVPINADFMNGYADDPEGVAHNVAACVETGVAGLSIEDSGEGTTPLYDRALAIERIRAARAAIDASGTGVVLTARCEAWLRGVEEPAKIALDRLVAFADAGADCLYAPDGKDPRVIGELVKAVAPKPLNVLISGTGLTVNQLADLGVRRISTGGALARAAWAGFIAASRALADRGELALPPGAPSHGDVNRLFS
jgi:2-methylisocitrate lyase-like PEP mutase family enzyme